MRSLDPRAVYLKALKPSTGEAGLDDVERLIYAVKELETYIAMSGWEAFFVGSCSHLCPDLRRCFELSRDDRSLAILDDFIAYLAARGVAFESDAIEQWYSAETDESIASRPDWGARFVEAEQERWTRIAAYLRTQGVVLVNPDTKWGPN
ncbi:MAG TPA: hypothetical protein VM686_15235 [Polyangiaceae bacterium]|nr:hypothetical protein [Polyangiaceae bacterium]